MFIFIRLLSDIFVQIQKQESIERKRRDKKKEKELTVLGYINPRMYVDVQQARKRTLVFSADWNATLPGSGSD